MEIKIDNSSKEIADFLQKHIDEMKAVSPPESTHALDLARLKKSDIILWTLWYDDNLIGCGAIKELNKNHAEIKSMRIAVSHRRKGIASILLQHILNAAKIRGYDRISLETGSMPFFQPARQLYAKFGFQNCPPFSSYKEDPNSVFMTKKL